MLPAMTPSDSQSAGQKRSSLEAHNTFTDDPRCGQGHMQADRPALGLTVASKPKTGTWPVILVPTCYHAGRACNTARQLCVAKADPNSTP